MLIDPYCLLNCPIGYMKCIEKAQAGKKRKLRKLYPGHPWTIKWCPVAKEAKINVPNS